MRSVQRLNRQESGLGLDASGHGQAPGPLPSLSLALPKQDKVLTRSATISTAVLSTFDQVNITSAIISSTLQTHNISLKIHPSTAFPVTNNIPTNNTPFDPLFLFAPPLTVIACEHCKGHVGVQIGLCREYARSGGYCWSWRGKQQQTNQSLTTAAAITTAAAVTTRTAEYNVFILVVKIIVIP